MTCMQSFSILAWLEVCQEPYVITSDLEDIDGSWPETWRTWIILDLIIVLDTWFLTSVQNFCILAWLGVCQEPLVLDGSNSRTLRVPDWRLGGHGHPWHHGSPWGVPRNVLWKLCVIVFIFGWYIRVCYNVNKNMTNRHTNQQRQIKFI